MLFTLVSKQSNTSFRIRIVTVLSLKYVFQITFHTSRGGSQLRKFEGRHVAVCAAPILRRIRWPQARQLRADVWILRDLRQKADQVANLGRQNHAEFVVLRPERVWIRR